MAPAEGCPAQRSTHSIVTADQPGHVVQLSAAIGEFAQPGTNPSIFVTDIWVWAA
jgi:membrane fusion protein, multidrug efflux system